METSESNLLLGELVEHLFTGPFGVNALHRRGW